jgi:hypothetical protein
VIIFLKTCRGAGLSFFGFRIDKGIELESKLSNSVSQRFLGLRFLR